MNTQRGSLTINVHRSSLAMSIQRGSLVPRDMDSSGRDMQLRVIPAEVKFLDTMAGRVYRLPLTVHNLCRWNQKIRFKEPIKPQFKLMLTSLDKELASGLQMTAMVEYHPDKDEDTFDRLLISIENKTTEIPLIGLIPSCQLEIESVVNFGTLVANSKVYSKEITITNHGKAPGIFKAEYHGQLPILIFPTSGIVDAKSSMVIKVDFCADQPRIVDEEATVILQGQPEMLLSIKAHVVEQIIELLNMSSDRRLECIHFGPVFFGSSKIKHARVYNNSPEPINWVAIIQDDAVGEELGTDIRQRTDIALNNLAYMRKIKNIDTTIIISCLPNEGTLQPYQKTVITFCFTPKLMADGKKDIGPSYRQDYALFLRFESVGSKDGFLRDDDYKTIKSERFQKMELALTGTGLPVLLQFDPGPVLNFKPCFVGERSEIQCIIKNQCELLPVMYHFKKTANFEIDPEKGEINGGGTVDVMCSFVPHQLGVFKVKQMIEIIGLVAEEDLQSLSVKSFHHVYLAFNSICKASTKKVVMKFDPGILPSIRNPTGKFVVKDLAKRKNYAPVAMLQSAMTRTHNHRSCEEPVKDMLLAFPNDRAATIRSKDHHKHFRPIFTKVPRFNCVNHDFAYTTLEKQQKKLHENYYAMYLKYLRSVRLQKKQAERERMYSYDDTDIGLEPGSGLKSPSLSEAEIEEELSSAANSIRANRLLTTRSIASQEEESVRRKVLKGLKSEPSTPREKHDCSLILTPKKIHQVIVGPSVLNFGNICVNSPNTHLLHVINMLPMHVLLQLDTDLEELQKTNQFSYVIPPTSSTYISMVFESPTIGKFWKSFTFTVNNVPSGHILVMAVVQLVTLELSSNELVLRPRGFFMKTCFRGTVRLYNRQNCCAQFQWQPVNTGRGIAFSICPAKGTVEAYSSLECEVTWQQGFSSPEEGEFILHVFQGNALKLKCVAHLGRTKVLLLQPRILFSNCPQGLTTWRKAVLQNVGQNHAYFKVCSQSLLPIINIIPSQGIVPFGGITVLNISCKPTVAEKFDTRAKVCIRHANVIDLRIGGSAEIADVEINPEVFNFSGAYIGGTQIIPFVIKNKGITRARVEFNLKDFPDFSMDLKDKSEEFKDPAVPYIYSLELEENTSLECSITFSPKEVTVVEFIIQVQINFFESSKLYTKCLSSSPSNPKTVPLIRPCYVQATALQSPLNLSSTKFLFEIPLHEMNPNNKVTKTQNLVLYNITKHHVTWTLDLSNTGKLFKDGTFKFSVLNGILRPNEKYNVTISFCPNRPGKYTADIPMLLNYIPVCYKILCLTGEVKSPELLFDPPFIFFTPVPLDIKTVMDINILPQNYFRNSTLCVQIPTVRLLDGEEIHPLSVKFPKGRVIPGSHSGINNKLTCHLSFKSSKPVSFFTNLLFCDDRKNWFSLPVTATAENCILTIYPYMAIHLDKQNIILKNDKDEYLKKTRDSVLPPYQDAKSPSPASIKKTYTTSKFNDAEPAKGNLFIGVEVLPENLHLDESETSKEDDGSMEKEKYEQFLSLEEGTKAHYFFEKVVNAAQTWFSLFGWPEGPHSFSIPETIRRDVCKMQFYSSTSPPQKFSRQNDFSKYNKTIYDVLLHLSGKMPPGINSSQSLPVDNHEKRVIQLHLQHSSLLDFLNAQGGCISHVLPEFLLEPEDYKRWIEIMSSTNTMPVSSCTPKKKCSIVIEMSKFEAWSKRAWTDVFLQIYKVLVLSRVVPYCSNNMPPICVQNTPKVNPCFASSNIYSDSERILLSWMNINYENTRHVIWKNCHKDVIPSERWIVNFDKDLSDGLVFATQLGAYCPFLIESHFINMYTRPKSPEEYLHNCLIIVNTLYEIDFDMEIQATDICDPNPILMLMLCVYMYERLPTYLPKKVVSFECTLHDTVLNKILLKNSSSRNLVYNARIVGRDAADFSLSQKGNVVTISPRNEVNVTLKFTSRFIRPAEASLLLISKPKNAVRGITMTFALKGKVLDFKAIDIIKCESPCYQFQEVTVNVKNPFHMAGDFSVILVESSTFVSSPTKLTESRQYPKHDDDMSSSGSDTDQGCCDSSNVLHTSIKSTFIREFFCSMHTVHLGVKGTSSLELRFLPFNMHVRYCVIILSNKKIGQLIYVAEGKGMTPLPSSCLPMNTSSSPVYYSSTREDGPNKKYPVLYLKWKPHQILYVDLKLPMTNEAKEKALAFAAQQQMSRIEYERRLITGTLESSSIRVAIALLGLTKIETLMLFHISKLRKPKTVSYTTELSLPEYFYIPEKIYIPRIPDHQVIKLSKEKASDGYVPLPLQFLPLQPGRYPCKILLKSRYDVRAYYVEGIVNEEQPEAKFEFETPAFEALTQNIPIKNQTNDKWTFQVTIEGEWFYGPIDLHVGPDEIVEYPLTFKPIFECVITGKLILQNEVDGMEHIFDIKGVGKKPLALEHITVECQVGNVTQKHITLPHFTNTALTFTVTADLPIVWGNPQITVHPYKEILYLIHVRPWKRGILKGTITFSTTRRKHDDYEEDTDQDQALSCLDSITEQSSILDDADTYGNFNNLRFWYNLEIHSTPGPPIEIMEMTCIALDSTCIEIPLSNPKDRVLHLDVQLTSAALNGDNEIILSPLQCTKYIVWYSPATTGYSDESIIFQPEMAEEFWYLLKLTIELPKPTTMPEIQCDLGKHVTQIIPLVNRTHETLKLQATNSNPENFVLDINRKSQLIISPHSTTELPVLFYPSALGRADHQACINFYCTQFTEWKFCLSGVGLFPQPLDTERITTRIGLQSTIVIPFKNPTTEDVLIDITLTSVEHPRNLVIDHCWDSFIYESSAFRFSSPSEIQGIALPPKGNIDISLLFIPQIMKLHKTMVIIEMTKANGKYWPIDNFDELNIEFKSIMGIDSQEIQAIHWIYPIVGLPQAPPPKSPPVVIQCQSRKRAEEKVEIILNAGFFGYSLTPDLTEVLVIPKRNSHNFCEDPNEIPKIHEFEYEIQFESEALKSKLESCVALYMIEKSYDMMAKKITFIFNLVFTPKKPLRSHITLKIECVTEGIWKFPIMLIATQPDTDAVIDIEGVGLFKESVFELRLKSQTRNSEPFTAHFLPGSDLEFFVKPQAGELLPFNTNGTLITVGFKPKMYCRKYKATLVIQTEEMYWKYEINGLSPTTVPPKNAKAKIDATHKTHDNMPVRPRNFVRENTKLIRTGVSSTIKGAPLVMKNQ
ncbi:cilia- and flagella-associated protein 47 [Pongo pygmaeus]|uniref:cilia- and flagella-associated protein 47 n=1 Tax=Pongo pygmaeus TaxID=9600 RepID=UPI0023E2C87C|nr:cilia- and flagella-associated protein 47 [Pongo pygmaeus]